MCWTSNWNYLMSDKNADYGGLGDKIVAIGCIILFMNAI